MTTKYSNGHVQYLLNTLNRNITDAGCSGQLRSLLRDGHHDEYLAFAARNGLQTCKTCHVITFNTTQCTACWELQQRATDRNMLNRMAETKEGRDALTEIYNTIKEVCRL